MSGQFSFVKSKNVVPHDIGDPGRKKTISVTTDGNGQTSRVTHLLYFVYLLVLLSQFVFV